MTVLCVLEIGFIVDRTWNPIGKAKQCELWRMEGISARVQHLCSTIELYDTMYRD